MNIKGVQPFYVSAVCVFLGFDGESFHALVANRCFDKGDHQVYRYGLPGKLVAAGEHLDDAAQSVLDHYCQKYGVSIRQFRVFGDAYRCDTNIQRDELEEVFGWKENRRIFGVAYVATTRISKDLEHESEEFTCRWHPVADLPDLCFDHKHIIEEAVASLKKRLKGYPDFVYSLLAPEFTAADLRKVIEAVVGKKLDIRNFYKKIEARPYLVPTDKKQTNVAHRAARYYRFDPEIYKKRFEDSF